MLNKRILWVGAGLAITLLVLLLGRHVAAYVPVFSAWVESLGPYAPLVFILGYIVATVAFVPGSILTLAGGAMFGIVRGSAYVFIGASIGSICAFLVSRYVARGMLVRRFAHNRRFQAIDIATRREGRKIVFLLRLSPAVPFNAINYVLGLTNVRLRDYSVACVGMIPVIVLWAYYGRVIGDVAGAVSVKHISHGFGYWAMLVIGLIATVAATAVITRAAKRALHSSVQEFPE
jgi:uncharacterized membrane protein YdjX (TVP38/TMEM64 family)